MIFFYKKCKKNSEVWDFFIKNMFYNIFRHFFALIICICRKNVVSLPPKMKSNTNMKQVHMGGYSIVIPENYVHRVKVSRLKGSRDVRLGLAEAERAAATASAFAEYPCWESDLH